MNSFFMILGSREINDYTHFYHTHPKSIEMTFSFPEFAPAHKKQFIPSNHS